MYCTEEEEEMEMVAESPDGAVTRDFNYWQNYFKKKNIIFAFVSIKSKCKKWRGLVQCGQYICFVVIKT